MLRQVTTLIAIAAIFFHLFSCFAENQITNQTCYAIPKNNFKTIIPTEKQLDFKWKLPYEKGSLYKVTVRSFDECFMRNLLEKNHDSVAKKIIDKNGHIGIRGKKYVMIVNQKTGMLTMALHDLPYSNKKVLYKDDQFYVDNAVSFLKHCDLYDEDLVLSNLIKQSSAVDLYFFFKIDGHIFNGTYCRVLVTLDSNGDFATLTYTFPKVEFASSFPFLPVKEAYMKLLSGRGSFVYHNDYAYLKGVIQLGRVTGIDLVYLFDKQLNYAAPYYRFEFEPDKAGIVPKGLYPALEL
jgi:hypothetical protein